MNGQSPSWPIVTVAQMRALEAAAFARGATEDQLQRQAAVQVALAAGQLAPATTRVVVLVGPGNNGRDAFLAGRLLADRDRRVLYYLTPRHSVRDQELSQLDPVREQALRHSDPDGLRMLGEQLSRASLLLDGLIGIGGSGPLRPPLDVVARLVSEAARRSRFAVVAVDLPSGIDADSGAVPGDAIKADLTVALGAVKAGLLRFPAADLTGTLRPAPIGLPVDPLREQPVRLLDRARARALVPARPRSSHKGTLGWVMVIGGSRDYIGAPVLSAAGAARSGCGLVGLAVPPGARTAAASLLVEATFLPRDAPSMAEQAAELVDRSTQFDALVLGPGIGRRPDDELLVRELLSRLSQTERSLSIVIDADALYSLARWPEWWKHLPPGCVLTPHHGEMARLTGRDASRVSAATWELAIESAARWNQILVLKGAHTVVARPDGAARVYGRANPHLATAGTGDVLAGAIAGLAAQGPSPADAAELAVVAHSLAAERAAQASGGRSLLASDLLPWLPVVLSQLAGPGG